MNTHPANAHPTDNQEMTTKTTPSPSQTLTDAPALDDAAVELLARQFGQDPAVLRARLLSASGAPLVRDHIESYLATLGPRTRSTYRTPLRRLRDSVGPVCDQTCTPCLDGGDFVCRCSCAACRDSRVTIPALGDQRVSPAVYSEENTVAATRSLFEDAKKHTGGTNHGKDVHKPRRTGRERRPPVRSHQPLLPARRVGVLVSD